MEIRNLKDAMRRRVRMLAFVATFFAIGAAGAETPQEAKNKVTVLGFTAAMQDMDLTRVATYLADDYIQHNPNIPQGKAAFLDYFREAWKGGVPLSGVRGRNPPVFVVAEKDMVVLVLRRPAPEPLDPTKTYDTFWFEAYRVKDGKLAEHWDEDRKRPPRSP